MSDRTLVSEYMQGGNVTALINKYVQEGIDPAKLTAMMMDLDKASALRKDQQSITEGEVIAIKTHGTIEQIKDNFTKKLLDGADNENISLLDQKAKLYCMMNKNPELPLKAGQEDAKDAAVKMNPMLKKIAENVKS